MKRTAKFTKAEIVACSLNVDTDILDQINDNEELYRLLNERKYYWNSKTKEWEELTFEGADPPTEVIRIRIWSDGRFTEDIAQEVIDSLSAKGLRCVSKSSSYPCRKPNQLESRVYLDFLKNPEEESRPESGSAVLVLGGLREN
ncbi:MAG: hypothetical protein RID09_07045 [Coleofasciculus sp. G1-WW12-02]|uniref:hypothetical protein n=1 Tax=Coleofasciculus sp. G1-WW12-02 TaxID=3068483 RepID=UPI0032F0F56C